MSTDTKYRPTVYIGPTIIKYGLFKNKTFKGGIPREYPTFKGLFNECPLFEKLFAEPDKLRKAKINLNKKGTAENLAAAQLIEYVKKEAK